MVTYVRGENMTKKELIVKEIEQVPEPFAGRSSGLCSVSQNEAAAGEA